MVRRASTEDLRADVRGLGFSRSQGLGIGEIKMKELGNNLCSSA